VLECVELWQREETSVEGVKDETGGREWVGVVYAVMTVSGGMGMVWIGREGVRRWEKWRDGNKHNIDKGGEGEGERDEVKEVEAGTSVDAGQIEIINGHTHGLASAPIPSS
jgi:hypothetical protein